MRVGLQASLLFFVVSSAAFAQDWAKAMFDHTFHDFGVVARGATVEHRFTLKNIYLEDAEIASVRSSCGCTTPQMTKQFLKTYDTGDVVAVLDTRKFLGQKDATLFVKFAKPFPAEVQLRVASFIRGDVVFEPGAIRFGTIVQGTRAPVRILVSYAGRDDWKITDIQSNNRYLEATIRELSRFQGKVTYELGMALTEKAPVGYVKDFVLVTTNDRASQTARIMLAVDGIVIPPATAVTAGPSPLLLGVLSAGQTVSRRLVVRGQTPFRILEVSGPDDRFRFQRPTEAKAVHVIPTTVAAGVQPGTISGKIRIRTDAPGYESLEVVVDGRVVAASLTPATAKPLEAIPSGPAARDRGSF